MSRLTTRLGDELAAFPRQFWLLTAGIFVLLTGVDMCFPMETLYLTDELGVSASLAGLMIGVPILLVSPLHIAGGAFTDRYGRKPAMAIGIAVVSGLYLTFAFASSAWPIALALVVESGLGWALFLTGSNAMIADLIVPERRTEAYGITRVALNIGMFVGPAIAGVLLALDPSFRTLFLTGSAICALFVAIVLVKFRETRPAAVAERHESLAQTFRGFAIVFGDRRLVAFCAIALLPLYGFGQIWSILPVALQRQFDIPAGSWSRLLMTYALAGAIMQYPVVRFVRHRDHFISMSVSAACIGLGLGGAVLAPLGPATFVAMVVLSLGVVILIPISSTIAAELAPMALRGRYMSAWTLVQMCGYALGPTFGGLAIDRLGVSRAFAVIVALGLTGSLLFAVTARWFRRGVLEPASPPEARTDGEEDSLPAVPPSV